jgi:hypothetical protein
MNQMRVAVIGDMETIEIVSLSTEKTRIIPKTGQESICVPGEPSVAEHRQALKASDHVRSNAAGAHVFRSLSLKLVPEHVGHQIHTGPVLFGKIADETQAQFGRGMEAASENLMSGRCGGD